ncbi:hypothetical protein [Amycolatopsis xylanica]|uniref:hypothetical protein n=1 Tax=Amycolatopsis xylanica TaxID=589385 RepID=UPI000B886CEB|nr:hypothetical protein [Amycolatopsis xylanica]
MPEEPDAPTPSQGIPRHEPSGFIQPAKSEQPADVTPEQPADAAPEQPSGGFVPPSAPEQPSGGFVPPSAPEQPAGGFVPPSAPAPQPGYAPAPGLPLPPQWNPQGYGKPGVVPLRPLNLGEILDGAITIIRRYPGQVLGVSAIIAVISAVLNFGTAFLLADNLVEIEQLGPAATDQQRADQAWRILGPTIGSLAIVLLITVLMHAILQGYLTTIAGKAVLGRPVSVKEAVSEVGPRIPQLVVVGLLYGLMCFVGLLLCVVGVVVPGTFFALASAALILERSTIMESLRRSGRLVSKAFGRVLGFLIVAYLISWVLSFIIQLPFDLGAGGTLGRLFGVSAPHVPTTGDLIIQAAGSVVVDTLIAPFSALVIVLIYVDLRMRQEGMDIDLARAAGTAPQNPPAPPQQW